MLFAATPDELDAVEVPPLLDPPDELDAVEVPPLLDPPDELDAVEVPPVDPLDELATVEVPPEVDPAEGLDPVEVPPEVDPPDELVPITVAVGPLCVGVVGCTVGTLAGRKPPPVPELQSVGVAAQSIAGGRIGSGSEAFCARLSVAEIAVNTAAMHKSGKILGETIIKYFLKNRGSLVWRELGVCDRNATDFFYVDRQYEGSLFLGVFRCHFFIVDAAFGRSGRWDPVRAIGKVPGSKYSGVHSFASFEIAERGFVRDFQ
ncbi:hypothetical protein [Bradyrhizobium ivorense]|uniref:hypothetical protein n=1 Tax=Bradyrhizobium ivorense TaxID=2511166 RepID=UPI00155A7B9A|nr:hypothetical protein [Bradyrhizobium ivorense]